MFQNDLNPPLKSFTTDFCVQTKMQQYITMTAYDATMNVIIWIHVFPS